MFAFCFLAALTPNAAPQAEKPFYRAELIFAPEAKHNHGSCIVECPNGDLLACWYRGSGERSADDVTIVGARLTRKAQQGIYPVGATPPELGGRGAQWTAPFPMADTPGFPDCNPCMIITPDKRLWLFWPVILDNHWESALLKYKVSRDYAGAGEPRWETERVLHLKPGPEFLAAVNRDLDAQAAPILKAARPAEKEKIEAYLADLRKKAETKLSVRLGWMPRAHPYLLDGKRLILPLYSDGFSFSLMAYTDDAGANWKVSEPLVGPGNVQPTLARRKDGTLAAYFRDNGPPPQRVMQSESRDGGLTWTLARDIEVPDPGAGLEVLVLKSGRWLLVGNGTERGRHQLAIHVSEDEGRTWRLQRYLERDAPGPDAGSYAYPSIIQARDGTIHVTYSYTPNKANAAREGKGETIKRAAFNEAWLFAPVTP